MFQHFNCIFKFNLGFWNYVQHKFQLYYLLLCYCRMELEYHELCVLTCVLTVSGNAGAANGQMECGAMYRMLWAERVGVGAECFGAYMRWCLSRCQCEITRASAN